MKWIFIMVVALLALPFPAMCADNRSNLSILSQSKTSDLLHLVEIPLAGFDDQRIVVVGEKQSQFSMRIWSKNIADDCDFNNFSPVCKAHKLFFVIKPDVLGGQEFGVETPEAFRWTIERIDFSAMNGRCVRVVLVERIRGTTGKSTEWEFKKTSFCITPTGLQ